MSNDKLELFKYDACPFCMIVINYIKSHNLQIEYRDVMEDQENLKRLVNDTGRRTVPCLYINNKPMFESRDIIAWLASNLANIETIKA